MSVLVGVMMLTLGACGGDDGGDDSLFTGLSGVIIVGIVIWLFMRSRRSRT